MKTDADLSTVMRELTKLKVDLVIAAGLDENHVFVKHDLASEGSWNRRIGSSNKRIISGSSAVEIDTPRDQHTSI